MTNLTDLNKYYRTDNATATASDIASGKTAYIDGGKVIGTSDLGTENILFWNLMTLPTGALTGSEVPQYVDNNIVITPVNLTKTANGVSPASSAIGALAFSSMPAVVGDFRRYIYTYSLDEVSAPVNAYMDFQFNYQDTTHHWQHRIIDQTGDWVILLYEYNGGSTERGRVTPSSIIENATLSVILEDHGDTVSICQNIAEPSTNTVYPYGLRYSTAGRSLQSELDCRFVFVGHGATNLLRLQSVMIQDVTY